MYSNWKNCPSDLNHFNQSEDFQNNCDRCGKLYRYNWRRRRTREKTCNFCITEVKYNLDANQKRENKKETGMSDRTKSANNFYLDQLIWETPLPMFQFGGAKEHSYMTMSESIKKVNGIHELTETLFLEMKIELEEELQNPQRPPRTEFDWPCTDQLSKVGCLRAFNVMKQILLKEISKCEEVIPLDPLILRKKFYLERRFQSLEKEKIRRLKIYERLFIQEETEVEL